MFVSRLGAIGRYQNIKLYTNIIQKLCLGKVDEDNAVILDY